MNSIEIPPRRSQRQALARLDNSKFGYSILNYNIEGTTDEKATKIGANLLTEEEFLRTQHLILGKIAVILTELLGNESSYIVSLDSFLELYNIVRTNNEHHKECQLIEWIDNEQKKIILPEVVEIDHWDSFGVCGMTLM